MSQTPPVIPPKPSLPPKYKQTQDAANHLAVNAPGATSDGYTQQAQLQAGSIANQSGLINPLPLNRSLVLLPNSKLQEFEASVTLLQGYLVSLQQTKTIQARQKALIDQQLQRLQSLLGEFQQLNAYEDPNNLKTVVNGRLASLRKLEQQFRETEAQMFQALSRFQVRYKDTGILATKLAVGIEEQVKVSDGLYGSVADSATSGGFVDDNLALFVEQYCNSRSKYHYLREVQKRLVEDRIGGII